MTRQITFQKPMFIKLLTILVLLLLTLPLISLVLQSFLVHPLGTKDNQWTLKWYLLLAENNALIDSAVLSLFIAFASATLTTIIATLGALGIELHHSKWGNFIYNLSMVPLILPELVLGISSVIWFGLVGFGLGMPAIIAGHVTFSLAYAFATIHGRLATEDPSLAEAAQDLGATPLQVLRKITLPRLKPAILASWLMALTLSFDDFLISFFTSAPGQDTLPLKLYSLIRFGMGREVYALSAVLVTITMAGLGCAFTLNLKPGISGNPSSRTS